MAFEIDIENLKRLVNEKRYDTIGLLLNKKSDEINGAEDFRRFVDIYLEFLSRYRGLDKITADDLLVEIAGIAAEADNYYSFDGIDGRTWELFAKMIVFSVNRL